MRLPFQRFGAVIAGCLLWRGIPAGDWPAWRGPTGLGIASESEAQVPLRWSATEQVRWKVALPEPGNSTPIVWGERIFLTQATRRGTERATHCFSRADGHLLWKRSVAFAEPEPTHGDNPYCSASPVTDGARIVVSHGSAGIFCYDLDGQEIWRRDLGKQHHIWGNAASPVLDGGRCYLNCGPGDRSFLVALDAATGATVWQVDIPGGLSGGDSSTWTGSWSSPILVRAADREDLVISLPQRLLGLEPGTGKEIWRCEGLGRLVYTSPLAAGGVIVALSGYMGPGLALRAGGQGDVTASHRLWRHERAPQRIGSGVIVGEHVYQVNEPGVAECLELKTGVTVWKERLGQTTWSSLVQVGERLYAPDQGGDCAVFRAAPRFELLARNSLGELTRASLAVSRGDIFIRTYKHLWCIGAAQAD